MLNPSITAMCDGFRVLCNATIDGPRELSRSIVSVLLVIMDRPEQRVHLRLGNELESILADFTDAYSKLEEQKLQGRMDDRLLQCSRVFACLLKTWTGFIFFCAQDKRAIRSLVHMLSLPYEGIRVGLDLLLMLKYL